MPAISFRVEVLKGRVFEFVCPEHMRSRPDEELRWYLHQTFARFSKDGWLCEARVSTCRAWKRNGGVVKSYDLGWDELSPPGETPIGRLVGAASDEVIARITTELAAGEAVWLFSFNADADLCYEEILSPVGPSR